MTRIPTLVAGTICLLGVGSINLVYAEEQATTEQKKEETAPPAAQTGTVVIDAALQKAVDGYMTAWQKHDYDAMYAFESWEGGDPVDKQGFMQGLSPDFVIQEWKVTKVTEQNNGQLLVLVLTHHTPPKEIQAFIPPEVKFVRTTLRQYWKKEGDKYAHLYHIEKKNLLPFGQMPTGVTPLKPEETPKTEEKPVEPKK